MTRARGITMSPSQRLKLTAALRHLWTQNPYASLREACEQTGAPRDVAGVVRKRLVAEGVVPEKPPHWRRLAADNGKATRAQIADALAAFTAGGER